ncbi:MAG TPA: hypothetical protein PKB10_04580, partial [Tepidisphaeraceae bacterium]|nr:hypothetical protein [Tepidisphaeraceae bacterium]
VSLCFELGRATVVVKEDQLSLAIGKHGQNVRLAARLTGWDVDILTPGEFEENVKRLDSTLRSVEGVQQEMIDKIVAMGIIDVRDISEVGAPPLVDDVGMTEELAYQVIQRCADEAKLVEAEQEAKKAAAARAKAAAAAGIPLNLPSEQEPLPETTEDEPIDESKLPLANEATPGVAPELTTHDEASVSNNAPGAPDGAGLHVVGGTQTAEAVPLEKPIDENEEMARIAEGRDVGN